MSVTARVAVVGGGWAGLSAACLATRAGCAVTVFEMAPRLGGRARGTGPEPKESIPESLGEDRSNAFEHDNGQHILIGAYRECLKLMQLLGLDLRHSFLRLPLQLLNPQGQGLRLQTGRADVAFAGALWRAHHWAWSERARLLGWAIRQRLRGFQCPASWSVQDLCAPLPKPVVTDFIEPLCLSALNTPVSSASASVFLRVLQDGLMGEPGCSDLLIPKRPLEALLPQAARAFLQQQGAQLRLRWRVQSLELKGLPMAGPSASRVPAWRVDGEPFDGVILACSSSEAARLTKDLAPNWAQKARELRHEAIITAYLEGAPTATAPNRWPAPLLMLPSDHHSQPAQFVFHLGQIEGDGQPRYSAVMSAAGPWLTRERGDAQQALLDQWTRHGQVLGPTPKLVRWVAEKRATFSATVGLKRPQSFVAPGLYAAGDYVDGPYPATLEGAVRSAQQAVSGLLGRTTPPN